MGKDPETRQRIQVTAVALRSRASLVITRARKFSSTTEKNETIGKTIRIFSHGAVKTVSKPHLKKMHEVLLQSATFS